MQRLTANELDTRLLVLDEDLESLPIYLRPIESFKRIYGRVDDAIRLPLFEDVERWYWEKYGDQVGWDGVVGRVPILINGKVSLFAIPFVLEDSARNFRDQVEEVKLEDGEAEALFRTHGRKITAATQNFKSIYDLRMDDLILNEESQQLILRGSLDLENAAKILKYSGDIQNSIFHSHAAAEKFLKVAYQKAVSSTKARKFSHDIPALFKELTAMKPRYVSLSESIDLLQSVSPNMDIRYKLIKRKLNQAISAFHASLSICGCLADMWLFDSERGSEQSDFEAGHFYVDHGKRNYYCTSKRGAVAHLTLFISGKVYGGSILSEIRVNDNQSAYYLKVTKKAEVHRLQQLLQRLRETCRHLVTPEEMGLEIASGPEGSYVTGIRKVRIQKEQEEANKENIWQRFWSGKQTAKD